GRVRAAADDGGDVGVGQPGQVVIGDGLFLFGGQPGDGPGEIAVEPAARTIRGGRRRVVRRLGGPDGAAGRRPRGGAAPAGGRAAGPSHAWTFASAGRSG